jgi:hypothetical protein
MQFSIFYTEPEANSGHKNMVAIFAMAYLAGKPVTFYVDEGKSGYWKLLEGSVN